MTARRDDSAALLDRLHACEVRGSATNPRSRHGQKLTDGALVVVKALVVLLDLSLRQKLILAQLLLERLVAKLLPASSLVLDRLRRQLEPLLPQSVDSRVAQDLPRALDLVAKVGGRGVFEDERGVKRRLPQAEDEGEDDAAKGFRVSEERRGENRGRTTCSSSASLP